MNKIIQTISSLECSDKKSRLLTTDSFTRDIKKYKQDKKFLSFVEKITENLNMIGHSYIQKLRGTKKLHNNDVFEFRSCIKGHRFLFKFGWQLNGRYGVIDSDLILCRYVAEHEQIGLVAQKINEIYEVNEIDIIEEIKACKISKVKHDFDVEQEKLYIYHYEYNMPILSVQQTNIIQDDSNIVLVNGIAGSGKTNICIQKLISLCSSESGYKVLYSTFSQKLLDSTEKFLKDVYMEKINKILLNSSIPNFKEYVSNELALINLELNDIVVDETNISQLLKMISYNLENNLECKDLFGIYKNYCNKNCNKVIVVDYEVFERLVNDKKIIYFHPNYDKKIEKLSLGLIFKEIEGVILGSNISSS